MIFFLSRQTLAPGKCISKNWWLVKIPKVSQLYCLKGQSIFSATPKDCLIKCSVLLTSTESLPPLNLIWLWLLDSRYLFWLWLGRLREGMHQILLTWHCSCWILFTWRMYWKELTSWEWGLSLYVCWIGQDEAVLQQRNSAAQRLKGQSYFLPPVTAPVRVA